MALDPVTLEYGTDWNNLVISDGSMFPTPFTGVATATTVTIAWDPIPTANQSEEDLFFMFINGQDGQKTIQGSASRVDGTIVVPMTNTVASELFAVGFFMNPTSLIVSPSYNLNIVVT